MSVGSGAGAPGASRLRANADTDAHLIDDDINCRDLPVKGTPTWRTVSWTEWRLLAASVPLVIAVRISLWLFPSGTIVRRVREIAARPRKTVQPALRPAEIAWAVEAAARRVPGATCLTQAVSAHLLLLRHGHQAELCVGVARDETGAFRAHAWVEIAGRIAIGGNGARGFSRLADFPLHGQGISSAGER